MFLKVGPNAIENAEKERNDQNVGHGEMRFGEVSCYHLADRVGVDEPHEENKGNEMLSQNHRVEVEVSGNEYPSAEKGEESIERKGRRLLTKTAGSQHIKYATESQLTVMQRNGPLISLRTRGKEGLTSMQWQRKGPRCRRPCTTHPMKDRREGLG